MAEDSMGVLDTVRKAMAEGDVDFLREAVRILAEGVMEAEVSELTGVPKGIRDPEHRLTSRNGYRERRWDTRVGPSVWRSPGAWPPRSAEGNVGGGVAPAAARPAERHPSRNHRSRARHPVLSPR